MPITVVEGQSTYKVLPRIYINGREVQPETPVKEGDRVEILKEYTLEDLLTKLKIDLKSYDFAVNGKPYGGKTIIRPGDYVTAEIKASVKPEEEIKPVKDDVKDIGSLLKEVEQNIAKRDGITVKVNGQLVNIPPKNTDYLFLTLTILISISRRQRIIQLDHRQKLTILI